MRMGLGENSSSRTNNLIQLFTLCSFRGMMMKKGSSRNCVKRCQDGNQSIPVWLDLLTMLRHTRDMGPELEALVTFTAPRKSTVNLKKYLRVQT